LDLFLAKEKKPQKKNTKKSDSNLMNQCLKLNVLPLLVVREQHFSYAIKPVPFLIQQFYLISDFFFLLNDEDEVIKSHIFFFLK
jgi:hypothetical protein